MQSGQAFGKLSRVAITSKAGFLALLVKPLTEAALEGELDAHLADDVSGTAATTKPKRR